MHIELFFYNISELVGECEGDRVFVKFSYLDAAGCSESSHIIASMATINNFFVLDVRDGLATPLELFLVVNKLTFQCLDKLYLSSSGTFAKSKQEVGFIGTPAKLTYLLRPGSKHYNCPDLLYFRSFSLRLKKRPADSCKVTSCLTLNNTRFYVSTPTDVIDDTVTSKLNKHYVITPSSKLTFKFTFHSPSIDHMSTLNNGRNVVHVTTYLCRRLNLASHFSLFPTLNLSNSHGNLPCNLTILVTIFTNRQHIFSMTNDLLMYSNHMLNRKLEKSITQFKTFLERTKKIQPNNESYRSLLNLVNRHYSYYYNYSAEEKLRVLLLVLKLIKKLYVDSVRLACTSACNKVKLINYEITRSNLIKPRPI